METENLTLSQSDVEKLMADPSPGVRAETTSKLAAQYERKFPRLTSAERNLAEDIFRALTRDVEVIVRQSLSQHLKTADDLPNDVALALAQDVDAVALPMIKFSEVLSDDDLVSIIDSNCGAKQVAVAGRDQVSGRVADALIDTGNESAVARLVANEGADLDNDHFGRVLDEYKDSDAVSNSLNRRPSLPPQLSERMMSIVSERLQDYLVSEHDLAPDLASNVVLQARERATVTLLSDGSSDEELERLVEQLHAKGRLTASLTLRALCMGDQAFFEVAMARLGGVPLHNARILIHDQGSLGMESLYGRAGLPPGLYPAFRAAVHLRRETDYDGGAYDRERFMSKMIQRILTQFEEPDSNLTEGDIDYLLGKLKDLAA